MPDSALAGTLCSSWEPLIKCPVKTISLVGAISGLRALNLFPKRLVELDFISWKIN